MFHKSPYLRLTLFYVLIVMAISVLFSVTIYSLSARELDSGLGLQTRILHNLNNTETLFFPLTKLEQIKLAQLDESRNNLKAGLLYLNLTILVISSFLSYFLAKQTMRPIEDALYSQNCFTADASHELRTPLTAMKTEVEVALRDKEMNLTSARKLLQSNLEEIAKLESLTNALLKVARSQEVTKTSFAKIFLPDLVVEAYEKIESLAKKKSINFSFKSQTKKLFVSGEAPSLKELFVILFDNAIKYSPENSRVAVVLSKDNKHAVVSIKDRGIGIKASDLPFIFNRFYRSDGSRSKDTTLGYGLGLSIARNIAEIHQGVLSVESQPGRGSEFKLILPIVKDVDHKLD